MADFNRPLPQRKNDKLRNNLLSPNVEKPSSVDPSKSRFPVEDIVPDNIQPQKSTTSQKCTHTMADAPSTHV